MTRKAFKPRRRGHTTPHPQRLTMATSSRTNSDASAPASQACSSPVVFTLSPSQLDECHDRAEELLVSTISAYGKLDRELDLTRWKYMGSRVGVSAFRERWPSPNPSLLCVGTMKARLDDVLTGLHCTSSEEMRAHCAIRCSRVSRCAVLQVAQAGSEDDPSAFTGVKWAALRVLGGCVADRDIVFFEKMGMVTQAASGRRLAYLVMQSLPRGMIQSTRAATSLELCYLLEELDAFDSGEQSRVGVYMLGSFAGFGRSYMAAGVLCDLALSITRTVDVARAMKLAALIETSKAIGPATETPVSSHSAFLSRHSRPTGLRRTRSSACDVCRCTPYVFETFSKCAGCQRQQICRRCRTRAQVLPEDDCTVRSATFCTTCLVHVDSRALRVGDRLPSSPTSKPRTASTNEDEFQADQSSASAWRHTQRLAVDGVDQELLSSARSLAVFSLKISQHLLELDAQSEQRLSNLSSLGTEEMARMLASGSSHVDQSGDSGSDEESDVLESFHTPSRSSLSRCQPGCEAGLEVPRLSRFSTASSSASSSYDDDSLEAHRHSLLTRLQAANDQAELTFCLARAHSQAASMLRTRDRFEWLD